MRLARRLAEHFVAPAGDAPADELTCADGRGRRADTTPAGAPPTRACAVPPPRTPASVALLAAQGDAPALAAGLALALARRERASTAVVCVWSAGGPMRSPLRAPALPAAARLAAVLAGRGHVARASGRLVSVGLAAGPAEAAAEAMRVSAAAGAAPTVLALAGPRAAAFDVLLDDQDLVVVAVAAGSDPALAQLAVAGLQRSVVCEVPPAHPGRSLAAAGVALLPSARRLLAAPVEALS